MSTSAPIGTLLTRQTSAESVRPDLSYSILGLLNHGRGVFNRGTIAGPDTKYAKLHPVCPGDLVFSRLFAWEGSVAISDRNGWVSPEFPVYRIKEDLVVPHYLAHAIRWERFIDQLAGSTVGMGQRRQRVEPAAFEAATIPLPDLDEQRRIAARLDAVVRAEGGVRDRRRGRPSFRDLVPTALERVFDESGLCRVPARELFENAGKVVRPGEAAQNASRFVGLEHIESNTGRRLGSLGVEGFQGRKLLFETGDVLYGYLRPYQNKVWVADGRGLTSVEQYALRPRAQVKAELLGFALRSEGALRQVNEATHHLQLPRIRLGSLEEVLLPDVREAPADLEARLAEVNRRATRLLDLDRVQGRSVAALLPAARNEEFARLVTQAG